MVLHTRQMTIDIKPQTWMKTDKVTIPYMLPIYVRTKHHIIRATRRATITKMHP